MSKTQTKMTSSNKYTEKDKFIVVAFVIIFIVIIVMVLQGNKMKSQKQDEANNNFNVPQNDVKIELSFHPKEINTVTADYEWNAQIVYLEFVFMLRDMPDCYKGLIKSKNLFESGFVTEALFEYATVVQFCSNRKLQTVLYRGSLPNFGKSIAIAGKNGILNKDQCNFLHKLRKLRNVKAHQPGVDFPKEIAILYLNSGFELIESNFI